MAQVERLVKIAIVVVVAYLAYSKGLPWVRDNLRWTGVTGGVSDLAGGGTGDGGGGECVRLAALASQSFGSGIGRFQPPYDLHAWDAHVATAEDNIDAAARACRCSLPSCDRASDALSELRDLVYDFDATVRSEVRTLFNPGRQQGRIDDLLNEARALARQGQ